MIKYIRTPIDLESYKGGMDYDDIYWNLNFGQYEKGVDMIDISGIIANKIDFYLDKYYNATTNILCFGLNLHTRIDLDGLDANLLSFAGLNDNEINVLLNLDLDLLSQDNYKKDFEPFDFIDCKDGFDRLRESKCKLKLHHLVEIFFYGENHDMPILTTLDSSYDTELIKRSILNMRKEHYLLKIQKN